MGRIELLQVQLKGNEYIKSNLSLLKLYITLMSNKCQTRKSLISLALPSLKTSKNSIFLFNSSSGEGVIIMLKGKNLSNSKGFRASTKYETKKSDIIDKSIIDRRL